MSIVETSGGDRQADPCSEVAIQAGDGAELLSDFDAFARINAEAKVRESSRTRARWCWLTRNSPRQQDSGPAE